MSVDFKSMTLEIAAELIQRKSISPVELVKAHLDRIEKLNPVLNAYVTIAVDSAMKDAHRAEEEISRRQYRGPLHGIPVSVKDIFYTRGIRTTFGEKRLETFIPDYDAAVVERLKEAGAVLVGKTNPLYGEYFPEPEYGLCRNPWDLNRLAGYSSSGAAAAVAAGTDLASIGSDGGGSVRYPAACCGVVGLKPTFGRISRYGAGVYGIPNDYIGPLTRTARDCALVMQAIAGHDDRDPYSAPAPVPNYIEALDGDLKEIKVGIPNEHFWDYLDGDVESAVRSAISLLGELGCSVLEVSMPTMAMVNEIHTMLSEAETAAFYQPQMQHFTDETPGILFQRIERGAKVLAADYIRARKTRDQLNADIEAAFKEVDVLVTPTSILPAPPIGQFEFRHMGRTWVIGDLASRLTRPFNTSGHPAISVPCGFTHSGLPIGLQLVGPNFGEATLLKVADAYQRAAEQSTRWPSL